MTKRTKLSAEKVLDRAMDYFSSYGLEIKSETPECCLELGNELGFVTIELYEVDNHNEVKISTREFEYQIQEFLTERI